MEVNTLSAISVTESNKAATRPAISSRLDFTLVSQTVVTARPLP